MLLELSRQTSIIHFVHWKARDIKSDPPAFRRVCQPGLEKPRWSVWGTLPHTMWAGRTPRPTKLSLGGVCEYRSTSCLPTPWLSALILGTLTITCITTTERGGSISTFTVQILLKNESASPSAQGA